MKSTWSDQSNLTCVSLRKHTYLLYIQFVSNHKAGTVYKAMDNLLSLIYINQILRYSLLCYKALITGCLYPFPLFYITDWLVPKVIRQDGQRTHLETNVSGATVRREIFSPAPVLFSPLLPSLCIENLG